MKIHGRHYRTIWTTADTPALVEVIDQRRLPFTFTTVTMATVQDTHEVIKNMVVRGAGLIGATSGYGMYLAALHASDTHMKHDMSAAAALLKSARPTATNLAWAADRVLQAVDGCRSKNELIATALREATTIAEEDAESGRQIGLHGLELIKKRWQEKGRTAVNILTHCNAGWLAFVDYGSATAPIYAARDQGIDVHVWVDETRPWNQGARLTAFELQQEGIANTLITDNAGGHLMQRGEVDMVLVGTDRTTHTGDVANKIGTYLKALAARDNNIPFYVALPSSTFDWVLDKGSDIPIEQRAADEITSITGVSKNNRIETVRLAATGTVAANYGFDVTPARLVSALITERGIINADQKEIHALFPEYCLSS